jgi:hypothetical protein
MQQFVGGSNKTFVSSLFAFWAAFLVGDKGSFESPVENEQHFGILGEKTSETE